MLEDTRGALQSKGTCAWDAQDRRSRTHKHNLLDSAVIRKRLPDPARHRGLLVRREVAEVGRVVERATLRRRAGNACGHERDEPSGELPERRRLHLRGVQSPRRVRRVSVPVRVGGAVVGEC